MDKNVKMSKEDFISWSLFRESGSTRLEKDEIDILVNLHSKYLKHKLYYPCTCNPKTYNKWISQLNKIHDNGEI